MLVKISKADAEQSIGFALTNAQEEYDRVKSGVGEALQHALAHGGVTTAEEQQDMARALTRAREAVQDVLLLQKMADFASEEHGVLLDAESFSLLQPNLPAR